MEYTEFKALFEQAIAQNSVEPLDDTQIHQFYDFNNHLLTVNKTTNLTAIRNISDVIYKHDIDSLLAAKYIPKNARVLDVGCGPGFPAIPLAIARPDITFFALDSTAKKIAFVNSASKLLALDNLTAIAGRAEDAAISRQLGSFDIVISRAVARMNVLTELCLPYVRIGGHFIALKGAKAAEEIAAAQNAITKLGGTLLAEHNKPLVLQDETQEARCTIIVKKKSAASTGFPRAFAMISKKPL